MRPQRFSGLIWPLPSHLLEPGPGNVPRSHGAHFEKPAITHQDSCNNTKDRGHGSKKGLGYGDCNNGVYSIYHVLHYIRIQNSTEHICMFLTHLYPFPFPDVQIPRMIHCWLVALFLCRLASADDPSVIAPSSKWCKGVFYNYSRPICGTPSTTLLSFGCCTFSC